jgi:inorganic pyrophosphatase
MIAPGVLVIGSPLVVGVLFGPRGVSGLLAGAIVSGVQIAISFSNTGGAWDNAKKYIEAGTNKSKKHFTEEDEAEEYIF